MIFRKKMNEPLEEMEVMIVCEKSAGCGVEVWAPLLW